MTVDLLAITLTALRQRGITAEHKLATDSPLSKGLVLVKLQNPTPVRNGFTGAAATSRVMLSALAPTDSQAFALAEQAHDALRETRLGGEPVRTGGGEPMGFLSRLKVITLPVYVSAEGVSNEDVSQVDILLQLTAKAAHHGTVIDRI